MGTEMFLIRSLREKGTLVEVVQGGKVLYIPLVGYAATETEVLTDDIKTQTQVNYIQWEHIHAKPVAPPEVIEEAAEVVEEEVEEEQPEVVEEPVVEEESEEAEELATEDSEEEVVEEEELEEEVVMLSKDDFQDMKKAELKDLIAKNGLDIDPMQNKYKLVEELSKLEIPKE